jgi:hypothetical protein
MPHAASPDVVTVVFRTDTAVPSVVDGSIPPNKSDLKFFGVYQEGSTSGGFLNLFWSRVQEPSGTTNMDFEFNQSNTLSANGVTPVRTAGDLLIIYDLAQGGTHPVLSIREDRQRVGAGHRPHRLEQGDRVDQYLTDPRRGKRRAGRTKRPDVR